MEVGDALFVNFPTDCQDPREDWPEPVEVRVVGIGLSAIEVPPKNGFYLQGLHTTPAFVGLLPEGLADLSDEIGVQQQAGAGVALRLDPGTTLADLADTPGVPDFAEVITSDLIAEPVDAGLQTDANALWLVALVGTLATLAVLGPTLARFAGELAEEDRTLAAMGWGRPQRMARGAAHGTVVAVVAVATAVVVMAIASRWTPIGDARTIEPDPGIEVDLLVLLMGSVGLTVLVVGFLALLARRSTRPRPRPRQTPLAALAARLGLRPPAVLGIRIGLEPAPAAGTDPLHGPRRGRRQRRGDRGAWPTPAVPSTSASTPSAWGCRGTTSCTCPRPRTVPTCSPRPSNGRRSRR